MSCMFPGMLCLGPATFASFAVTSLLSRHSHLAVCQCTVSTAIGVGGSLCVATQALEALREAVPKQPCVVMDTLRAAGVDVRLHLRKKHDFKSSMGTHVP